MYMHIPPPDKLRCPFTYTDPGSEHEYNIGLQSEQAQAYAQTVKERSIGDACLARVVVAAASKVACLG